MPSPEAFAKAKEDRLIFVTIGYKPLDGEERAISIFVETLPRVGETLVIEDREYLVQFVVHRIEAGALKEIPDFVSSAPRVLAVEVEEDEDDVDED
jgi:hypothetical protein